MKHFEAKWLDRYGFCHVAYTTASDMMPDMMARYVFSENTGGRLVSFRRIVDVELPEPEILRERLGP